MVLTLLMKRIFHIILVKTHRCDGYKIAINNIIVCNRRWCDWLFLNSHNILIVICDTLEWFFSFLLYDSWRSGRPVRRHLTFQGRGCSFKLSLRGNYGSLRWLCWVTRHYMLLLLAAFFSPCCHFLRTWSYRSALGLRSTFLCFIIWAWFDNFFLFITYLLLSLLLLL